MLPTTWIWLSPHLGHVHCHNSVCIQPFTLYESFYLSLFYLRYYGSAFVYSFLLFMKGDHTPVAKLLATDHSICWAHSCKLWSFSIKTLASCHISLYKFRICLSFWIAFHLQNLFSVLLSYSFLPQLVSDLPLFTRFQVINFYLLETTFAPP